MIPVKLQNELLIWIDNKHPYGISWATDGMDRIANIEAWLDKEFAKRLNEVR